MGLRLYIVGFCLLLLSLTTSSFAKNHATKSSKNFNVKHYGAFAGGKTHQRHATQSIKIFNVKHYGAVADGKTDNTKVFQSAWSAACALENGRPRVFIPNGLFLVGPIIFKGPCKSPIEFQVKGTVIASSDLRLYKTSYWIQFHFVDRLLLTGNGKFDGQGALAWPHNNCKKAAKCKRLPSSLTFGFVTNSIIQHISSINSKNFHMHIFSCRNLKLEGVKIYAPDESPNTDGIHIGISSDIIIRSSIIGTGDDCISLGPGSRNISISKVFCGPGHGISVGSLGKTPKEQDVVGLSVTNCTFVGTTNGVRIKTWQESPGVSLASNFIFEDLVMKDVDNPILIDQKYCPNKSCSRKSPSKVKISNVKFQNIRGESTRPVAVKFLCSDAAPCQNIELTNINLKYKGGKAIAACNNAKGKSVGLVIPQSCF